MHYLERLRRLHDELQPAGYLEIGVDWGDSLGLSRARSVAIDPAPKPRPESLLGKPGLLLYVRASDDFFREHERETTLLDAPLDLAFIDGLHEFAQVVRDLQHVERWGHPGTVVAIHDVLPRNAWEAAHVFHDGFWTGDVWRIVPFLREHRPDLRLWLTEAEPSGMLIVNGLDPTHAGMGRLAEVADAAFPPAGPEYDRLVDAFVADAIVEPAEAVIRTLGLGRRLEREWVYATKWGMRLVAESSWRPLLKAAADLAHTDQHREGWLFLVNEPAGSSGDAQTVFPRFVFMRSDFVAAAVSPHFWVTARGEDVASGLTRFGDDLVTGFTSAWRDGCLARIPLPVVLASLLPLAVASGDA